MTSKRLLFAALAMLASLAAWPAAAQTGVEVFNGNWQSASFSVEEGNWPELDSDGFAIAVNGGNRGFEAEWTGIEPDDAAVEWDTFEVDFEPADRPGYFEADDTPELFDGDPQYWAFVREGSLSIGRLEIDDDTGLHVIFVCTLTQTDDGLDAVLVLSTAAGPIARAHAVLQRR